MKRTFTHAPPLISEGRIVRFVSNDGWEIFVYPVMYGYRVRLCRVEDSPGSNIDWCGGADTHFVALLVEVLENILEHHDPEVLPKFSQIKPAHLDLTFMGQLANLVQPGRAQKHYQSRFDWNRLRQEYNQSMSEESQRFMAVAGGLGT